MSGRLPQDASEVGGAATGERVHVAGRPNGGNDCGQANFDLKMGNVV